MIVNQRFEISDEKRNQLHCLIHGKQSKKMVGRDECRQLLLQYWSGLINQSSDVPGNQPNGSSDQPHPLEVPDPEDIPLMGGRHTEPGFCRGWNKVKRGIS